MQDKDKEFLKENRVFLVQSLEPEALKNHLRQEDLLNSGEFQKLEGTSVIQQKNEIIIDALPRKGPKALEKFLDVVEKKQLWIRRRLRPSSTSSGEALPGINLSQNPNLPVGVSLKGTRKEKADKLLNHLSDSKVQICWVSGCLGSGKSAVALAACHQLHSSTSVPVYYVDLRSASSFGELIEQLLLQLAPDSVHASDLSKHRFKQALRHLPKAVFFFDNCDSMLQKDEVKMKFVECVNQWLNREGFKCLITACSDRPFLLESSTLRGVTIDPLTKTEAVDLLAWYYTNKNGGLDTVDKRNHKALRKLSSFCEGIPSALMMIGKLLSQYKGKDLRQTSVYNLLNSKHHFLETLYNYFTDGKDLKRLFDEHFLRIEDEPLWTLLQCFAVIAGPFPADFGPKVLGLRFSKKEYQPWIDDLKQRHLLRFKEKSSLLVLPELFRQHIMLYNEEQKQRRCQSTCVAGALEAYSDYVMQIVREIIKLHDSNALKAYTIYKSNEPKIAEFFCRKVETFDHRWFSFAQDVARASCRVLDDCLPLPFLLKFYRNAINLAKKQKKFKYWKAAFIVSQMKVLLERSSYNLSEKELLTVETSLIEAASFIEDIKTDQRLQDRYWAARAGLKIARGHSSEALQLFEENVLDGAKFRLSFRDWNVLARASFAAARDSHSLETRKNYFYRAAGYYGTALAEIDAVGDSAGCVRLTVFDQFRLRFLKAECCFHAGEYATAENVLAKFLSDDEKRLSESVHFVVSAERRASCLAHIVYCKALAYLGAKCAKGTWNEESLRRSYDLVSAADSHIARESRPWHPLQILIPLAEGKISFLHAMIKIGCDEQSQPLFDRARANLRKAMSHSHTTTSRVCSRSNEETSAFLSFLSPDSADELSLPAESCSSLRRLFFATNGEREANFFDNEQAFDLIFGDSYFHCEGDEDNVPGIDQESDSDESDSETEEEIRSAFDDRYSPKVVRRGSSIDGYLAKRGKSKQSQRLASEASSTFGSQQSNIHMPEVISSGHNRKSMYCPESLSTGYDTSASHDLDQLSSLPTLP